MNIYDDMRFCNMPSCDNKVDIENDRDYIQVINVF